MNGKKAPRKNWRKRKQAEPKQREFCLHRPTRAVAGHSIFRSSVFSCVLRTVNAERCWRWWCWVKHNTKWQISYKSLSSNLFNCMQKNGPKWAKQQQQQQQKKWNSCHDDDSKCTCRFYCLFLLLYFCSLPFILFCCLLLLLLLRWDVCVCACFLLAPIMWRFAWNLPITTVYCARHGMQMRIYAP